MCRLYGFCATEPTKVECTLVHAQNALLAQSEGDMSGKSHAHGWGVAAYDGQAPFWERQAWAAYHGEHFQRAAARVYAELVIAHVRRATVGGSSMENTHPFVSNEWAFAHNGTVPYFDDVKQKLLQETAPELRRLIKGETDSEHIFYYALTVMRNNGLANLQEVVVRVLCEIEGWVWEIDANAKIGLNLMLTDGKQIAGSRLGRTLYYVERDGVHDCEICGFPHIHHEPRKQYRALVVASEPLSHENWNEMPKRTVWSSSVDAGRIEITPF